MITSRMSMMAAGAALAAGWAVTARRLQARTAQLALLEHRAERDGLTGLLRREGLLRHAPMALRRGNAVGLLDLDGFKLINDTYGHAVGDHVLREVAARLMTELDDDALIARLGGDEFAVICQLPWPGPHARLDDVVDVVGAPIEVSAGELRVGISLGVVWLHELPARRATLHGDLGADQAAALLTEALAAADVAMYEAKALRRGWRLYDPDVDPVRPSTGMNHAPRQRYREHGARSLPDDAATGRATAG